MATFAADTFNRSAEALGTSAASDGGTWTSLNPGSSYGGTLRVSDANRCRSAGGGFAALYHHSGTPASAEYDVTVDFRVLTTGETRAFGPAGRLSTSANTMYLARYSVANTRWEMLKIDAGSATSLGTFTQTLSADTTYTCKLEIRNATKKVYVDGVERISSTDNAVTAAGKAGLRDGSSTAGSDTTGHHVDNFLAADTSGGTAYTLSAASGAFTLTGAAAGLGVGRRAAAGAGAFTLTGTAADSRRTYALAAGPGAFVLTGQDAGLVKVGDYDLFADAGAFTLAGQPAAPRRGCALPAASGVFTLTGAGAGGRRVYALAAAPGSFALGAPDAALNYSGAVTAVRWVTFDVEFSSTLTFDVYHTLGVVEV